MASKKWNINSKTIFTEDVKINSDIGMYISPYLRGRKSIL